MGSLMTCPHIRGKVVQAAICGVQPLTTQVSPERTCHSLHDVGDIGLHVRRFLEAHGGRAQAPGQLALQLLSQGRHCSCLLSKGACSQGKA